MKKKIVSTMLCATMIATMLAGCGGSDNSGSAATDNGGSTEEAAPAGDSADSGETAAPAAGGGAGHLSAPPFPGISRKCLFYVSVFQQINQGVIP